ncbi:AT-hook motif nuclear-localized protein 10-like isoform X2 [Bidens hawaiensis]|uniref:AT-hook motif nuclear-localized protein 10-like isoform X2 n=1 Tax=Bidens hawaiensis TaxID=980011 RepID=UPI00404A87EE
MNGSESGGIFRQPMPPVTSPPPSNRYPPGVYSADAGGGGSGGGGGGVGFRQNINININEHGSGEPIMKRRGRPRKYGPGGSMSPPPGVSANSLNGGFEMQRSRSDAVPVPVPPIAVAPVSSVSMEDGFGSVKRMRGRPPGSLNKKRKRETYVAAGLGYTPHIIMVQPGEDVFNKIMSFSQTGPRAVCVMSGTGVVGNVTLRQAAISGGTATYEGRFDILSLSGSFVPTEVHGQRTRTGGLSITLSGSGDQVFGGVVAGLLTAATPVQVVAGTFLPENCNEPLSANHVNPSSVTPKVTPANHSMGPSSPPSHGTLSESSGGSESPLNRGNESRPRNMAWLPWS